MNVYVSKMKTVRINWSNELHSRIKYKGHFVYFKFTWSSIAVGFLDFENWSSNNFVLSLTDLKWSKWVGVSCCSFSNLCCCWCECSWHNRLEFASTRDDDRRVPNPDLSPSSSPWKQKNIEYDYNWYQKKVKLIWLQIFWN